jgi:hypothetical protein
MTASEARSASASESTHDTICAFDHCSNGDYELLVRWPNERIASAATGILEDIRYYMTRCHDDCITRVNWEDPQPIPPFYHAHDKSY